ncbi:MAG: hypothetical protein JST28_11295 [Acidobacteria bacterium]|nr:hypothetical protein [Acidobacteriota bacterium]
MRFLLVSGLLVFGLTSLSAQAVVGDGSLDSDNDGLADSLEQSLLEQFQPRFVISDHDCSTKPAEFTPMLKKPVPVADNGTIYGQAFPSPGKTDAVELHYYDLWRKDCGQAGHDLDAEHVSVLVERDGADGWKARYWYAAAHEDTMCDASQIVRAKALDAETKGPEIWVSAGKHGAFLSRKACRSGCGADSCDGDDPLGSARVVNLGELAAPMNGAIWVESLQWPLKQKMGRSDFEEPLITRLDRLPADEIAWANPAKRPAQAVILGGEEGLGGAATGLRATDSALTTADTNTSGALDTAQRKTGNALVKSYRGVKKALKAATGKSQGLEDQK